MNTSPAKSGLITLAQGLLQIFYPNLCWLCRQSVPPDRSAICSTCHAALFTDPRPSCPRCAATIGPHTVVDDGCPACRNEGFAFDNAVRLGPYDGLLRDVILQIKNVHAEGLAEIVAHDWAAQAAAALMPLGIHCTIPVPLHWWRRWQRGFNQSDVLAKALADVLHVPFCPHALRRCRATAMQSALSTTARRENMRGAFEARSTAALNGKTILLVDDVMTTGSTAHEAARALRQAGVIRVVVAVLGRAEE